MTSQLWQRIAVTLGVLLVWRLGRLIPVPGIDTQVWGAIFQQSAGGILGQANRLSGGALRSISIFSLAITPYVTAAILLQLAAMVSARMRALASAGEAGRQTLERRTRIVAVALAALQTYGIVRALRDMPGVVIAPGVLFEVTAVLTITAGMLVLVWLAGQITARGIGNGVAVILAASILSELPNDLHRLIEGVRLGIFVLTPDALLVFVLIIAAVTALVVVVERSRQRLPIQFAERRAGTRTLPAQSADLVLKLNPAGLMPVVLASGLLMIVVAAATVAAAFGVDWAGGLAASLARGTWLHLFAFVALIVLFVLVYTAFVCDPERIAASLVKYGGAIPGIAPGEPTAAYLDREISRTAALGAVYLVFIILLPDVLPRFFPFLELFPISGMSILVLVCVSLDIVAQVRGECATTSQASQAPPVATST